MLVCLAASSSSTVVKVRLVVHDRRRRRQAIQDAAALRRVAAVVHTESTDARAIWSIDRVWASSSPEHDVRIGATALELG